MLYIILSNISNLSLHFQSIFQNITLTEVELSSLRLSLEYVESDTTQTRTPHVTACQDNDFDNDFQDPPIPKQNKTKEKKK